MGVLEEVAGFFVLVAGFDACFVLEPAESGAWVDGSSYLFPSNGVAARSAQSSPANKRAGIIANMEEREERIISLYARFAHEEQREPLALRSDCVVRLSLPSSGGRFWPMSHCPLHWGSMVRASIRPALQNSRNQPPWRPSNRLQDENEQHPDVALVERVRAGDVSAYDELVRKYERQVFRIAQHITQNREDAEDVMQDAFLKAYEKLDQFQGNSKFYTWLVRIAVNESLMRLRKRRTGKMVSIDEDIETEEGSVPRDLADWAPDPEQNYTQSELARDSAKRRSRDCRRDSGWYSCCATWKVFPRRRRRKRWVSASLPSNRACCGPGFSCANA